MAVGCPAFIAEAAPALCRTVDAYCERTSGALDAEPLNAITNVLMLVAAWGAFRLQRRRPNRDAAGLITAMIVAIVAGGIGAFLFHTTATAWAVILDMAPFLVFMLLVLWLTLTRFFGWPPFAASRRAAAFILVIAGGGTLVPRGPSPAAPTTWSARGARRGRADPPSSAARPPAPPTSPRRWSAAAIAARQLDGRSAARSPSAPTSCRHLRRAAGFHPHPRAILHAPPRPGGDGRPATR
jgi:hypothetical protein